jgi:hypothetical protein
MKFVENSDGFYSSLILEYSSLNNFRINNGFLQIKTNAIINGISYLVNIVMPCAFVLCYRIIFLSFPQHLFGIQKRFTCICLGYPGGGLSLHGSYDLSETAAGCGLIFPPGLHHHQ